MIMNLKKITLKNLREIAKVKKLKLQIFWIWIIRIKLFLKIINKLKICYKKYNKIIIFNNKKEKKCMKPNNKMALLKNLIQI